MSQAAERHADEEINTAMEFAEVKLTLGEMIDFVWMEVYRRLGSQRARLLAGFIVHPDADEIQRAAMGMAVVKFLENCRSDPDKAVRWLRERANHG